MIQLVSKNSNQLFAIYLFYDALLTATYFLNHIVVPKDLALLRIDPPFEESDKIKPIPINDIYENLDGREVLISGWGKTTAITYPNQLQALHIKITSHTLRPGMISMLSSEGEGSCHGDSGGNYDVKCRENIICISKNQIVKLEVFNYL